MSPQDKVERVLKEIHIAFSKSETYNGQPDKVIIDRRKFLNLLDRLNQGIYDMMDQYEQTRQSRSNAERAFRKKGDEIIEAATANAEDVYAASVIYTADMIGAIRDLMDQTNDSMNDLFVQFKKELREQKDQLKSHENELQAQLADLADTKKYLSVIDDINRERARKNRDLAAEKEAGVSYAKSVIYTPPSSPEIKVNELYFENSGTKRPEEILSDPAPAEKPDIMIHTDAAYFKWKAQQEGAAQTGAANEKAENENAANAESGRMQRAAKRRNGRPAAEETVKSDSPADDTDEKKRSGKRYQKSGTDVTIADGADEANPEMESRTDASAYPNPEFPNEEAIRRAVLADELAAMQTSEPKKIREKREKIDAGTILKDLIFGKE